jgi:hypothetical protein
VTAAESGADQRKLMMRDTGIEPAAQFSTHPSPNDTMPAGVELAIPEFRQMAPSLRALSNRTTVRLLD